MAWMVALVLILFYLFGRFMFQDSPLIHVLPFIAVAVVIVDYLIAKLRR
jgi:hypothetical protein